ncbi:ATP-binding protein [uncultured Sulfitobacter sp.]|uniref:sensor histidine kinase n=1 Tax=uncultured Sulfitobacter sp. TaxID=191468 RepID=UPI00260F3752|nr:ATP-binding protein [uncultured Sulfitobacter sp.]
MHAPDGENRENTVQDTDITTLRILNSFAVDLISIPSVEDLFWYVAQNVVGRLKFNDCVIYQANDSQTELLQVAALGEKNPFGRNILNPLRIPFGNGITGQAAERREAIVVHDLKLDAHYITDTQQARSEICVPILCDNRVVGVIDSEHPEPNAFGDGELEVLITIAALTGAKLELLAEAERSQQRYHDLVEAHAQLSRESTNRKALEAELFNTRKLEAVGRLTGSFAHEFNNLFTVISGNLEFLEEDIPAGLPTETLNAAQTAAKRGVAVIQSMLAFSQRTRLNPQTTDLNTFIRSVADSSEYGAVKLDLAPDLRSVEVDLGVLEKVVANLLGNARDAMDSLGTITISTKNVSQGLHEQQTLSTTLLPGNYVRLSVSDSGTGIAQESLQQIFDPFYTTKPVGDGTGLGLSMVLGFMRQSGGTVEVKSDLGKGSTFHLYFPAE